MDITSALHDIGLKKKEVETYLSLLSLGTQPASVVARQLGIPTSTARFHLRKLTDKRFVSITKKANSFLFTAELPKNIAGVLKAEREKELEKRSQEIDLIEKLVPQLEGMVNQHNDIPRITFYEGIDGIDRMMYQKALLQKTDSYIFSASHHLAKKYPKAVKRYINTHNKDRRKHTDYVIESSKYKKQNQARKPKGTNFKYLQNPNLELKTLIQIDGDHIAIINGEGRKPVGISIENKTIAEDLRKIHQALWGNL